MDEQAKQAAIGPMRADFRGPPQFSDVAAERRYRLERLAAAFRLFGHFGFDEGVAGHITVRDPEEPSHFWVNPLGVHFSRIKVSDLVRIDDRARIIDGQGPINIAAFMIHAAIHAARPDVIAAAHAHTLHGRSFSSLGRPLLPITQDACAFYGDHAIFSGYSGVVDERGEGVAIAKALGPHKAVILQNHGLLTVGHSVDAAAWFFISMERCCQVQLLAEAAGTPTVIADAIAVKARDFIANDLAAWASFKPLYDFITAREPDLFD